ELAIILVDARRLEVLDRAEWRVMPCGPVDPRAAAINGYDESEWRRTSTPPSVAAVEAWTMLDGATVAGHNLVGFDLPFIEAFFARFGLAAPWGHRHLDTQTYAQQLVALGLSESGSLVASCEALGLDYDRPHRAMSDAQACADVHLEMTRPGSTPPSTTPASGTAATMASPAMCGPPRWSECSRPSSTAFGRCTLHGSRPDDSVLPRSPLHARNAHRKARIPSRDDGRGSRRSPQSHHDPTGDGGAQRLPTRPVRRGPRGLGEARPSNIRTDVRAAH
ncbi:MAG: hypothetical protein CSA66_08380, partial [Proteobacteria bacterium]